METNSDPQQAYKNMTISQKLLLERSRPSENKLRLKLQK